MAMKNEDTVSGGAMLVIGGVVAALAAQMGSGAAGATLPPNFFPLLCSAGLMLCGAFLFIKGLRYGGDPLPELLDARIAPFIVMLFCFCWWFEKIDYRVGAWVFATVTLLLFGIRRPLFLLIVPVTVTAFLYLAFTQLFHIRLPTWI